MQVREGKTRGLKKVTDKAIKKSNSASLVFIPFAQDSTDERESMASYYKRSPIAQESHHASHALTFFFFMILRTLKGERVHRGLLAGIVRHLKNLKEFLEDSKIEVLVDSLCESMEQEYDRSLGPGVREVHRSIREAARRIERVGTPAFLRISSALSACCNKEKAASICMYPWIVAHEDKILTLANYYQKGSVFEGLIPVPKPMAMKEKGARDAEKKTDC